MSKILEIFLDQIYIDKFNVIQIFPPFKSEIFQTIFIHYLY